MKSPSYGRVRVCRRFNARAPVCFGAFAVVSSIPGKGTTRTGSRLIELLAAVTLISFATPRHTSPSGDRKSTSGLGRPSWASPCVAHVPWCPHLVAQLVIPPVRRFEPAPMIGGWLLRHRNSLLHIHGLPHRTTLLSPPLTIQIWRYQEPVSTGSHLSDGHPRSSIGDADGRLVGWMTPEPRWWQIAPAALLVIWTLIALARS